MIFNNYLLYLNLLLKSLSYRILFSKSLKTYNLIGQFDYKINEELTGIKAKVDEYYGDKWIYIGQFRQDGKREGVGISVTDDAITLIYYLSYNVFTRDILKMMQWRGWVDI